MSRPTASVVIPTHNRRSLLADGVESCLAQSPCAVEIIIVDDGSTDGTTEFVRSMLGAVWPADSVRLLQQPRRGAAAARNLGMRAAAGDFVQFLDSDDILLPTKLPKQAACLSEPGNEKAVCCYCYGRLVPAGAQVDEFPVARIGVAETDPSALVRELCSHVVHGMQTSAPLWRRDVLAGSTGWREDIGLGDDLEYYIRLLSRAPGICFIAEDLFAVREHTGSRLSADALSEESLRSLIATRRAIFDTVNSCGLWDASTQAGFLRAMRTIYANALRLGNPSVIRDLEEWLLQLGRSPRPLRQFALLIRARRLLGRRALLGAHSAVTTIRRR